MVSISISKKGFIESSDGRMRRTTRRIRQLHKSKGGNFVYITSHHLKNSHGKSYIKCIIVKRNSDFLIQHNGRRKCLLNQ